MIAKKQVKKAMRMGWKKAQALKEGVVKGAWKKSKKRPVDRTRT